MPAWRFFIVVLLRLYDGFILFLYSSPRTRFLRSLLLMLLSCLTLVDPRVVIFRGYPGFADRACGPAITIGYVQNHSDNHTHKTDTQNKENSQNKGNIRMYGYEAENKTNTSYLRKPAGVRVIAAAAAMVKSLCRCAAASSNNNPYTNRSFLIYAGI